MTHISTEQPEALRQAAWLRKWFGKDTERAAQELEALHARVQELEAELAAIIAEKDEYKVALRAARTKLEVSQAQRVPLSDAQAWEVINATHNLEHFDPYEHNALFELVRATEAAHGITQEKQG